MSNNQQKWNDLGEEIKQTVSDSITAGDFSNVSKVVADVVSTVIEEARENINYNWQSDQDRIHENELRRQREWQDRVSTRTPYGTRTNSTTYRAGGAAGRTTSTQQTYVPRPISIWRKFKAKRIGVVSSVLYRVFGGIGLGIFLPVFLLYFAMAITAEISVAAPIATSFFVGIFGWMLGTGISQKKRLIRAERYMSLCGDKMYATIKEIAVTIGKDEAWVRKDIQKMISLGIFPEGHIDEWGTSFILSDEVYKQYRATNEAYKQKSVAEQVNKAEVQKLSELDQMIQEGEQCLAHLRELNDAIPDEGITADLNKLDGLLHEIFARVKEHPEQMSRMHKVMDYYLPTTVKLVEAYADFDKVSVPGKDITTAKAEIEKTLGVINDSFAELLNNLFQDAAFDVTTDAQVLQSMLSREGLAKEPAFATMNGEVEQ